MLERVNIEDLARLMLELHFRLDETAVDWLVTDRYKPLLQHNVAKVRRSAIDHFAKFSKRSRTIVLLDVELAGQFIPQLSVTDRQAALEQTLDIKPNQLNRLVAIHAHFLEDQASLQQLMAQYEELLLHDDANVHEAARAKFGDLDERATDVLLQDHQVAARVLPVLSANDRHAALSRLLQTTHVAVQAELIFKLHLSLDEDDAESMRQLMDRYASLLLDTDTKVRRSALGRFGKLAECAMSTLLAEGTVVIQKAVQLSQLTFDLPESSVAVSTGNSIAAHAVEDCAPDLTRILSEMLNNGRSVSVNMFDTTGIALPSIFTEPTTSAQSTDVEPACAEAGRKLPTVPSAQPRKPSTGLKDSRKAHKKAVARRRKLPSPVSIKRQGTNSQRTIRMAQAVSVTTKPSGSLGRCLPSPPKQSKPATATAPTIQTFDVAVVELASSAVRCALNRLQSACYVANVTAAAGREISSGGQQPSQSLTTALEETLCSDHHLRWYLDGPLDKLGRDLSQDELVGAAVPDWYDEVLVLPAVEMLQEALTKRQKEGLENGSVIEQFQSEAAKRLMDDRKLYKISKAKVRVLRDNFLIASFSNRA